MIIKEDEKLSEAINNKALLKAIKACQIKSVSVICELQLPLMTKKEFEERREKQMQQVIDRYRARLIKTAKKV